VVVAAVYLAAVAPLIGLYADREARLTDRQVLLARLHTVAAQLPALQTRLAELQASASARKITVDGSSDALASANLQSRLQAIAASSGVAISSTEGLPAENRAGYRRLGLRVAVNGEYHSIVRMLAAAEKANPPLIIGNLWIRSGIRAPGSTNVARADAGFELFGFRGGDTVGASRP